jgi:hypothetical protein
MAAQDAPACFLFQAMHPRARLAPALDAAPPPPVVAPSTGASYAYAPTDIGPRGQRETELCDRASHTDWLYLGGLVLLDVGGVLVEAQNSLQQSGTTALHFVGPVALGLPWGATLGGGYLALPKCDPQWVTAPAREGEVRASWPLALAIALLAGATAPVIDSIVIGGYPQQWSTVERSMHVLTAGVAGFAGALVPYILPPRTWAAARELQHLRVEGTTGVGLQFAYAVSF